MPASKDPVYHSYVRQKIDAGLADINAGRVHSHKDIRKEFIDGVREGFDQLDRGEGIAIDQAEKLIASWTEKGSPDPS